MNKLTIVTGPNVQERVEWAMDEALNSKTGIVAYSVGQAATYLALGFDVYLHYDGEVEVIDFD